MATGWSGPSWSRRKAKSVRRHRGQPAGHGGQGVQADVAGGWRVAADARAARRRASRPLPSACGRARAVATASREQLGVAAGQDRRQRRRARRRGLASGPAWAIARSTSRRASADGAVSRSRSASSSWTAVARAKRASWPTSSSRSAGVSFGGEPLAEEAGQRAAPFRVAAGDPPGGFLQRGSVEVSCRRDVSASSLPPSIWSSAIRAARRMRGFVAVEAGRGALAVGDLDQGVGQRVLQHAVGRSPAARRAGPARPTCRRSARAPRRRRAGCAADGLLSSSQQRRQRLAVAPEADGVERRLADRLVRRRPGPGGPTARASAGRSGSRPRRRCAAPRRTRRRAGPSPAPARRRHPCCASACDGPPAHRRPRVVQQVDQLLGRHRSPTPASARAGRRPAARPCGGRGRSPRARPACAAATSGSRACTSRRCRPRAGCRRRPRARRSGGSRGCRETTKSLVARLRTSPRRASARAA